MIITSLSLPDLLLPFLAVAAVLTVTPGPDMALVLKNGARGGGSAAWWTGLGCCAGIAVHAIAAVAGLSAILAASATLFGIVKVAGAGYLIYLGISSWWHSFRRPVTVETLGRASPLVSRASAFRQGLLSNLLNPKIVLIFLTLLPQFVAPSEPRVLTLAELAIVFLLLAVLWWWLFSLMVTALGRILSRPRVRKGFDRVTGAVLAALGVTIVVESI